MSDFWRAVVGLLVVSGLIGGWLGVCERIKRRNQRRSHSDTKI